MKRFVLLLIVVSLIIIRWACKNAQKVEPVNKIATSNYKGSNADKYTQLIEGLRNDYVLYYRSTKAIGFDVTIYGMAKNDSIFKIDSSNYWNSNRAFLLQDLDFIDWLLSFKYDTTNSGLWMMYHNPISSYLSECNLPLSNSRGAIILLENFLNGTDFQCYDCPYEFTNVDRVRRLCNVKYTQIETFLNANKGKNVDELRAEWKKEGNAK